MGVSLRCFLLFKSIMSVSPSISSVSCRKVSGEHRKTRIFYLKIITSIFSSKLKKYEVDIPKTVLIFLPIVFSKAGRSDASLRLLQARSFSFDPCLPRRFPQEDWDQLFSSSYTACKLVIGVKDDDLKPTIPKFSIEIGTTSRRGGLHTMSRRLKGLFKSSKS